MKAVQYQMVEKWYNIDMVEYNIVQRLHNVTLDSATVNDATINRVT